MARVFGDEVAVYEADIHMDNTAKELVVEQHGARNGGATEPSMLRHSTDGKDAEKAVHEPISNTEHVDNIDRK